MLEKLFADIRASLDRGDVAGAAELARLLESRTPGHPTALLACGIVHWKQGAPHDAQACFRKLTNLLPTYANGHHWLGNALHSAGHFDEASGAYSKAHQLSPNRETLLNLQMAQHDIASERAAFRCFLDSRSEGTIAPLRRAIDTASAFARRGLHAPCVPTIPSAKSTESVSFVTCSITPDKVARLEASLNCALNGRAWELICITDATSLCEGFMRGFGQASSDVIVFCHDDIEILCDRFYDRLIDALDGADLVGVVGTTLLQGPALAWTPQKHLHGAVTHRDQAGRFYPSLCSAAGPRIDSAVVLDGLFMATRRHVVEAIGYDSVTFGGWHFYDLDFSYRAWKAGLKLRIQTDMHLLHASKGSFDANYVAYSARFAKKHAELSSPPPFVRPAIQEVCVPSIDEAKRTRGWLEYWTHRASGVARIAHIP